MAEAMGEADCRVTKWGGLLRLFGWAYERGRVAQHSPVVGFFGRSHEQAPRIEPTEGQDDRREGDQGEAPPDRVEPRGHQPRRHQCGEGNGSHWQEDRAERDVLESSQGVCVVKQWEQEEQQFVKQHAGEQEGTGRPFAAGAKARNAAQHSLTTVKIPPGVGFPGRIPVRYYRMVTILAGFVCILVT
jgi:hypothetical protein